MLDRRLLLCDLEPIDSEIKRTFYQRKKAALKNKVDQIKDTVKDNTTEDKIDEEPQENPFKDYFNP